MATSKKAAAKTTRTAAKKVAKKAASSRAPPWERENPKGDKPAHHLSPQAKAAAKRRAEKAGRPYPNLVDNLHAAAEEKK